MLSMVAFPAAAALMIWGAQEVTRPLPDGWSFVTMAVAVFASLAAAGLVAAWVNDRLTRWLFEPQFGDGVRAKMAALRRKYPLAYG
jgi:hypothetical protein